MCERIINVHVFASHFTNRACLFVSRGDLVSCVVIKKWTRVQAGSKQSWIMPKTKSDKTRDMHPVLILKSVEIFNLFFPFDFLILVAIFKIIFEPSWYEKERKYLDNLIIELRMKSSSSRGLRAAKHFCPKACTKHPPAETLSSS